MVNEFILASQNSHKAQELSRYLSPVVTVLPAADSLRVVEDGVSFEANALKKAASYFRRYGRPTVADDSGLLVDALPGELGVYSARFGGEGLSDRERTEKLLERLKGESRRNACFMCHLCFYFSAQEVFFFAGKLPGTIGESYCGEHGFGYDPVFIPHIEGRARFTLAERVEWKHGNSHRARACRGARSFFAAMASRA